ncbi:hypothetical protein J2X17_001713 [Flavobacterium aquidurense]|nr:hypothetical protein [Flavobacterium aquidurense]
MINTGDLNFNKKIPNSNLSLTFVKVKTLTKVFLCANKCHCEERSNHTKYFTDRNPKVCHSEERGIPMRNSTIKITNLCRATCGDSSFLGMTYFAAMHHEIASYLAKTHTMLNHKPKKIPNSITGIWDLNFIGI